MLNTQSKLNQALVMDFDLVNFFRTEFFWTILKFSTAITFYGKPLLCRHVQRVNNTFLPAAQRLGLMLVWVLQIQVQETCFLPLVSSLDLEVDFNEFIKYLDIILYFRNI